MASSIRFAARAAVLLAVIAGSWTRADAETLPVGPLVGDQNLSPFYRWTDALPKMPGKMLRREPMISQAEIVHAGLAQRILYTSQDVRWQAGIVPVSGTLYLPRGQPPAGGWPLVAWAHGTLGIADSCAASWTGHKTRDAVYIDRWLSQNFAVVATDYQGLGGPGPHPYLIWEAEGRSVLDAARAVLDAVPDQLARKVFISGQSQGSGAALGATTISKSYAPDVPLLATVATGLVSTFPDGPYQIPRPSIGSPIYITLQFLGGAIPDGSPPADDMMTPQGKPLLDAARISCTAEMRDVARRDVITDENAFVRPAREIAASLIHVTDMKPVRLPVPVLLGTGLADNVLAPQRQYGAVAALCAAGTDAVWKTYPGMTHNGGLNASFDDALGFFNRVMEGQPVASNCSQLSAPGAPTAASKGIPFND